MLTDLARRDAALGEPKLLYLATVYGRRGLIALARGAIRVHLPYTSALRHADPALVSGTD